MITTPITPEKLNLNHRGFLIQANEDIHSALMLFFAGKYSQAAYLYQQAVEKACKFIALAMKYTTFDKLKGCIGHNTLKFFQMFFDEVYRHISLCNTMTDYHTSFKKMPESDRYVQMTLLIQHFMTRELYKKNRSETWVDVYIRHIRESDILDKEKVISETLVGKNDKNYQLLIKNRLEKTSSLNNIISALLIHAVITSDLEIDTRYPDKNDITPYQKFSTESPLVICMPYLLDNVRVSIAEINVLYNDPNNFKPLPTVPYLG